MSTLPAAAKKEVRGLEKCVLKLAKSGCSLLFNGDFLRENLLPNYSNIILIGATNMRWNHSSVPSVTVTPDLQCVSTNRWYVWKGKITFIIAKTNIFSYNRSLKGKFAQKFTPFLIVLNESPQS